MSEHGGNLRKLSESAGVDAKEILDFSANINPIGPPPWLRSVISRNVENLVNYPDPDCQELVDAISSAWEVEPQNILVGNGENELIFTVPRALDVNRVIVCPPAYIDYEKAAIQAGRDVIKVPLNEYFDVSWDDLAEVANSGDLIFLGHPNNPTGQLLDKTLALKFIENHPELYFFIDEAFIDFAGEEHSFIHDLKDNVIIGRSFTKFYAIPGLRLGALVASAKLVEKVRSQLFSWSVNTLALSVGVQALKDVDFKNETLETVVSNKAWLQKELNNIPKVSVRNSSVNYLLCRLSTHKVTALKLELLSKYKIAIRDCSNYDNLDDSYFRVAVKSQEENEKLIDALNFCLTNKPRVKAKKKTPALMIQGTASNAGKSILTAAFCRILFQDGVKVTPFKSQNMSLNSYVTHDGFEIARAQVVQAQASRLDPDIRMNPILLKPNADKGTQVIINGKVVDNMVWKDYIKYKATAFEEVKKSYDSLADEYDAVVLEGAGSPAEVNLKKNDIVNMGMARYANCPVLLSGDIDRGGVYASFVGTTEVLLPWERNLVSGFLVNRFRGDASLLQEAHDFVELHTDKPVLGVIPYIHRLGLPEEDSVSFKEKVNVPNGYGLDIAVIDFPKISNFTDVDAFDVEDDVNVRIVREVHQLGRPDCLILPGSKGTMSDFEYIKKIGLVEAILNLSQSSTCEIVGICGGFQMLGKSILDPQKVEFHKERISGLGLLDIETEMASQKILKQVNLGNDVEGYEIHHGKTSVGNSKVMMASDNEVLGVQDGHVWGTYLHGIFDNDKYRMEFLNKLRKSKGLPEKNTPTMYNLEPAFDHLAETVRQNVELDKIYKLMGL
ncbi:MAG: cobyric acid synthase [Lentisphaeraceae bacterium]|nr:cobyric acid synthase [Lentisphaeraceae bacterium]